MSTQVILLERVDNLGDMGDVVSVRPGYARNFLLPQRKALRASKDNVAYFEAQKKSLVAENDKRKGEAAKLAKKLEGVKATLIRQASESGQLFGSVAGRDIAAELTKVSGIAVDRSMIRLNQNFKLIGLFPVEVSLHPEVKVTVTINIARSVEEAETQAKTGRALIAGMDRDAPPVAVKSAPEDDEQLKDVLEEGALEARKERKSAAEAKEAAEKVKDEASAAKRAKKAEKVKAVKGDEASEEPAAEEDSDEE
ncbi:MAG: 50S ribosomal protein L9 [Alphaproteobacteria bacterium]|nr:50S ribosomal protein L9 [Alphaproteobacteria bacterium]